MNSQFSLQSRRTFLKTSAAMAGVAMLTRMPAWGVDAPSDEYAGLKMGLQSYTLRDRSFDKMLDAMRDPLKLHYVEIYPAHLTGHSPAQAMQMLKAHDVTAMSYGVVPFKKSEAANRKLFELAKTFGMTNLSCDPDPDSLENVDKLCHEYKITVAIHPHGPGHRWGKIAQLAKAFEGRSTMVGLCADTGHLIRAGEDPIKACEQFKDRLHAVHLKDFKKVGNGWEDVPAGEATLDVDALTKFLIDQKFPGGIFIEFEGQRKDDPEYPVNATLKSLDRVKAAVKKLKAQTK